MQRHMPGASGSTTVFTSNINATNGDSIYVGPCWLGEVTLWNGLDRGVSANTRRYRVYDDDGSDATAIDASRVVFTVDVPSGESFTILGDHRLRLGIKVATFTQGEVAEANTETGMTVQHAPRSVGE